jgi:hypothetical protein
MEAVTYQEQITANIKELRQMLWTLCVAEHSDAALTASREGLAAARSMQAMYGRQTGNCTPGDRILPLEVLPCERRRNYRRTRGGLR